MGKLAVNKLVIDNFVKGIGVLATNTDTKKLLFIETRSFNPLKISIKNNLIKLDNLDKIEILKQLNLEELLESYGSLPSVLNLSIKNIVVKDGKIIAAVNNLGTKIILKPYEYDKTKVKIPLYSSMRILNFLLVKKKWIKRG